MVSLLLAAGAGVNTRNARGSTPLAIALNNSGAESESETGHWLDIVTSLLKGGASLDECSVVPGRSAEGILIQSWGSSGSRTRGRAFFAAKALLAGVRQHGSYKRYMRAPHRAVLACRGLAMRGYLAPKGTRRTRGAQKWKAAVAFLAKQGDNGVVWNILSYWRAAD